MNKTILFGIDGCSWNVLMPMILDNKLKNFLRLQTMGSWGKLRSTIPPITAPAWVALATGLNPGKTAIIDFLYRDDDMEFNLVNSRTYYKISIWDIFSEHRFKVGVFNYPLLNPPYGIEGFMIPGLGVDDVPDTYPEDLKDEMLKVSPGYTNLVDYHNERYNDHELFLKDAWRHLEKQVKIFKYLYYHKEWDLFVFVTSVTDWLQHLFWKYLDKDHPRYDQEIANFVIKRFERFFIEIDRLLGFMLDQGHNVIIVSDHGFGTNDQNFNLSRWLTEKRFMYLKTPPLGDRFIKKVTESDILKRSGLLDLGSKMLGNLKSEHISSKVKHALDMPVDLERSKAYCLGHTNPFGAIYLTEGLTEKKKAALVKRIERELNGLGKEIDKDIKVTIYRSQEIFEGDKVDRLPALIFTLNDWRCTIHEEGKDVPLFRETSFSPRHTGSHRLDGVFMAGGPDLKKVEAPVHVNILDILPTLLSLYSIPIPERLDGRSLDELMREDREIGGHSKLIKDTSDKLKRLKKGMKKEEG